MNPTTPSTLKLYVERPPMTTPVAIAVADLTAVPPTVEELTRELERTRRALKRREAELAAGVPLVPQSQPQRHLSERLEAVLKGVVDALGCTAAGVYLLDAATTEIAYSSEVSLVGRLGKFGLGIMKKKAKETGEAFARAFRARLEGAPVASDAG